MKIVGKTCFLFVVGLTGIVGWHNRSHITDLIQTKIGEIRPVGESITPEQPPLIADDSGSQDQHSLVPLQADDLTLKKLKELRDAFNGTPTPQDDADDDLDLAIRVE